MSYAFDSKLGEQLYRLLPEVYRTRDKRAKGSEDLAKYLDAHGRLLDLVHATLLQQLDDALPETSQDWLLPYFARLLAASLVSPDPKGRHAEMAHAVSWRQRKGTLKCVEEIAEAVGQMEVEIQEGWKRVAMTPRIGMPLIPAQALDDVLSIDMTVPAQATQHPALPTVTVDLRRSSRAVEANPTNPAAHHARFGGVPQIYRQVNHNGAPCFPGSYEDVSRRTVDLRTPESGNGRYHHRRLLLFAPPPTGFTALAPIQLAFADRTDSLYEHLIEEKIEGTTHVIRNQTNRVIEILGDVTLDAAEYQIEGLRFNQSLSVADGGTLKLKNVVANAVQVSTFSIDAPVFTATRCLFDTLSVGAGPAELEGCTVLTNAYLASIDALDCIFMDVSGTDIKGQIQYSRLPESAPFSADGMTVEDCTIDAPTFFSGQTTLEAGAVLAPGTPKSVYQGASDGDEMGFYHEGRAGHAVRITGDFTGESAALTWPDDPDFVLCDVVFDGAVAVASGQARLERAAASTLTVDTALAYEADGTVVPSLVATDCLFDDLAVASGLARLVCCTVMANAACLHLQASDCIFAGEIEGVEKPLTAMTAPTFLNCIRYSSLPAARLAGIAEKDRSDPDRVVFEALRLVTPEGTLALGTNTLDTPVFLTFDYCTAGEGGFDFEHRNAQFGEPGYGVLAQATPETVRFGAEDGGEMGAYHHQYYSLKAEAVLDKTREFLPVGIEPVLILDTRLLSVPPEQPFTEE